MFRGIERGGRHKWALVLAGICLLCPLLSGAEEAVACAEGLELSLSTVAPAQGSLVLVEVRPAYPLASLRGGWNGQPLRFWGEGNAGSTQRALLGVDLGQEAGLFPLNLSAELADGRRLGCSVLVSVAEGEFITERLRVPRRFVELSPKDRERARRESRRLREIFATVTSERLWEGGFVLPVDGVEASGNFGRRRVLNDQPRSPHSGEDFSAPAGTPVRAVQRGRVALAAELFFSGKTVVVDHGQGLFTFYGHLESLAVEEGEPVEAGAVVGKVGASGRVTGAHLHWAVRLNEARVNPLDLLALLPE